MGAPIGSWNATYTPGSWVVLSGPRSMVILQPAPARVSKLIQRFWRDLLECSSIDEVSVALANRNLAQLDSFALLFNDDQGLHTIVKGEILVVDTTTTTPIVTGDATDSWTELSLGHEVSIRIEMTEVDPLSVLHLPLLVGGGLASSVFVTTRTNAQVHSVQSMTSAKPAQDEVALAQPADDVAAAEAGSNDPSPIPDTQQVNAQEHETVAQLVEAEVSNGDPAVVFADLLTEDLADVPAELAEPLAQPSVAQRDVVSVVPVDIPATPPPAAAGENEDSLVPPPRISAPETAPAIIRANFGVSQPLSGPVFIGRAPETGAHSGARIIKVPSQHTDISRNHLRISAKNGRICVTDLHSTNGSIVVVPEEDPRRLDPGEETTIPIGSIIDLGDGIQLRIDQGK